MNQIEQMIEQMIQSNGLLQADVIVLKKRLFGMLDHFAVYLGRDHNTNKPVFAANYTNGTEYIWGEGTEKFFPIMQPERIERFNGSEEQRIDAVNRALSKIGEKNYNYFTNNCEHYKNFVQKGIPYSEQANQFGKRLVVVGGVIVIGALLSEIFD